MPKIGHGRKDALHETIAAVAEVMPARFSNDFLAIGKLALFF
jgi:hypothetical protein